MEKSESEIELNEAPEANDDLIEDYNNSNLKIKEKSPFTKYFRDLFDDLNNNNNNLSSQDYLKDDLNHEANSLYNIKAKKYKFKALTFFLKNPVKLSRPHLSPHQVYL